MSKTAKPTLLDAIESATDEDLAALDEQIGTLEKQLATVRAARSLVHVKLHGRKKWTKKPKPAAAAPAPAANGAAKTKTQEYREAVAKHLLKAGATKQAAIVAECDIPAGSISAALDCIWFVRGAAGVTLSPEGRQAAMSL